MHAFRTALVDTGLCRLVAEYLILLDQCRMWTSSSGMDLASLLVDPPLCVAQRVHTFKLRQLFRNAGFFYRPFVRDDYSPQYAEHYVICFLQHQKQLCLESRCMQ